MIIIAIELSKVFSYFFFLLGTRGAFQTCGAVPSSRRDLWFSGQYVETLTDDLWRSGQNGAALELRHWNPRDDQAIRRTSTKHCSPSDRWMKKLAQCTEVKQLRHDSSLNAIHTSRKFVEERIRQKAEIITSYVIFSQCILETDDINMNKIFKKPPGALAANRTMIGRSSDTPLSRTQITRTWKKCWLLMKIVRYF